MKHQEQNNKKELVTAYPDTKEDGESFEVGKIKSWDDFVRDNLTDFKIQKGSQFEARLYLAFEETMQLFKTADYQYKYQLQQKDERIKELEEREKKLMECLEFVVKQSGTSTDYNLQARQCLKELEDR